jgi:hypothetical protein
LGAVREEAAEQPPEPAGEAEVSILTAEMIRANRQAEEHARTVQRFLRALVGG